MFYTVDRPHLQLALDVLDFDLALTIALQAEDYVDIIEAGTSFIKYNGMTGVRLLKERFAAKPVVADLKIVDAADIEVGMASTARVDAVTVMAVAPPETLRLAFERARTCGLQIIVDMLGVADDVAKAHELEPLGPDIILVHTGIDQRAAGLRPLQRLERLARTTTLSLGAAGGLQLADIPHLLTVPNLNLVVIGSAITSAIHPGEAARRFFEALSR